jgi:hypothetical protein
MHGIGAIARRYAITRVQNLPLGEGEGERRGEGDKEVER